MIAILVNVKRKEKNLYLYSLLSARQNIYFYVNDISARIKSQRVQ